MKATLSTLISSFLCASFALAKPNPQSLIDRANKELSVKAREIASEGSQQFSTVTVETVSYEKPKFRYKKKLLFGIQNTGFSGSMASLGHSDKSADSLSFSAPVILGLEAPFYKLFDDQGSVYVNISTLYASSDLQLQYSSGSKVENTSVKVFAVSAALGYVHRLHPRVSVGAEYSRSAQRSVIPVIISSLQNSSANHYGSISLLANYRFYNSYYLQLASVSTFDGQLGELTPNSGVRMLIRKEI